MVFNVQEARNLAIKAELLIQEQTRSTNYRRYGGVDTKALSDIKKTPLVVPNIVETANVGVGKRKSVVAERGKGNTSMPAKKTTLMQVLSLLSATDVESLATIPMNSLN